MHDYAVCIIAIIIMTITITIIITITMTIIKIMDLHISVHCPPNNPLPLFLGREKYREEQWIFWKRYVGFVVSKHFAFLR